MTAPPAAPSKRRAPISWILFVSASALKFAGCANEVSAAFHQVGQQDPVVANVPHVEIGNRIVDVEHLAAFGTRQKRSMLVRGTPSMLSTSMLRSGLSGNGQNRNASIPSGGNGKAALSTRRSDRRSSEESKNLVDISEGRQLVAVLCHSREATARR